MDERTRNEATLQLSGFAEAEQGPAGTLSGPSIAMRNDGEDGMPLVYIVLTLIIVGVVLWLINTYIPMAGSIKTILNIVVVVSVCVWVLKAAGLWDPLLRYRM